MQAIAEHFGQLSPDHDEISENLTRSLLECLGYSHSHLKLVPDDLSKILQYQQSELVRIIGKLKT